MQFFTPRTSAPHLTNSRGQQKVIVTFGLQISKEEEKLRLLYTFYSLKRLTRLEYNIYISVFW